MGRLVAFGASTIHGCFDTTYGGFARLLANDYERSAPGNMFYELGVWGDTLDRMLTRVSEVTYRRPQRTIVYTGLNDTRRNGRNSPPALSLDLILHKTSELLTSLADYGPIFIAALPINESLTAPYRGSEVYYLSSDVAALNKGQLELCQKLNVPSINMYALWSNTPERFLSDDGLHPNSLAHSALYEALKPMTIRGD